MVAPIGRVRVQMDGFSGAPGLLTFYWNSATAGTWVTSDSTAAVAAVRAFLLAVQGAFSGNVVLSVDNNVEVFEASSGAIIGVTPGTAVAVVGGTASGNTMTASGPLVQWITSDVVGRRLLRGRSFLTPSATGAVASTGTVAPALVATIQSAGATYIATAGPSPVVWHRPVPFKTGNNGSAHEITAVGAPSTVAVLRSRRD